MAEFLILPILAGHVSYSASDVALEAGRRLDEELVLTIASEVRDPAPRHRKLAGQPFELMIFAARSTDDDPVEGLMGSLTLRSGRCQALAYLPIDALWALDARISAASFRDFMLFHEPTMRGYARITGIQFPAAL